MRTKITSLSPDWKKITILKRRATNRFVETAKVVGMMVSSTYFDYMFHCRPAQKNSLFADVSQEGLYQEIEEAFDRIQVR